MYAKDFFASGDVKQQSGTCFVLMPFAQEFDEVYDTIREAVEGPELCFHCSRADELHGGGTSSKTYSAKLEKPRSLLPT
jgi:hypothetical protein